MNATNRHLIGGYIPERLWNRYEEAFKTEFRNNDGRHLFNVERTSSGLVEVVGHASKIELAKIELFHRGFRAGAGSLEFINDEQGDLEALARKKNPDWLVTRHELDEEDIKNGYKESLELSSTGKSEGREPYVVQWFHSTTDLVEFLKAESALSVKMR